MNAIDTRLKPPVIGTPIGHDFDYVFATYYFLRGPVYEVRTRFIQKQALRSDTDAK